MKKAVFTALILVASATLAAAQGYPSQSSQSSSSSQNTTVQGCLAKSDAGYTLTDKSGTQYELAGDTAALKDHVGHEVQITGKKAEAATPSATSKSTKQTGERLEVSKVKHISETCSTK